MRILLGVSCPVVLPHSMAIFWRVTYRSVTHTRAIMVTCVLHLQGHANLDIQNDILQTPLHIAVEKQHSQIVRVSKQRDSVSDQSGIVFAGLQLLFSLYIFH